MLFLPMIDMYPGAGHVYYLLNYLCKLATKQSFKPIITFDQPLYWKASEIIHNAPVDSHLKDIVLLLGSFHTFMNFLGAVGTLMKGTGLKEILEVLYGENAVVHMLAGKSVQRAFRGHLLVEKSLNGMIALDITRSYISFTYRAARK